MDKIINLTFDSQGTKTDEDISEIRQGDIGVVVSATFAQKNNSLYTARLNLTRSDDKRIVDVLMDASSTDSTKYSKKLDSAWYFAKAGATTITVFLIDANGNQVANGQVVVSVQKTDFSDEDVVLDPDEYANLIALISSKLNITDGIISKSTVSALGNLNDYNVGQVFYIKNDGKIYQLNSSYNLDIVVDLYLVNFTILNEVEVVETKTANQVKKTILLKNTENQTFYDFEIVFDVATTSDAGLMSASDKNKLNDLPTGSEIAQTYETKTDATSKANNLQEQIDAIISKSDVVDVVGTHAELEEYDTSKLGDNDIIKVLVDETKNNQRSYYRWLKDDEEFEYVGSEGEFYTKSESDQLFLKKVDAETIYQHKVKVMNTVPTTNDLGENEIAFVPSIEAPDLIVGNGLEVITDAQTDAKTLKVDEEVVALKGESYTKQEEDDLLDEKTNDADLSAVAKSGNYNDLSNKPTFTKLYKHFFVYRKSGEEHTVEVITDMAEEFEYFLGMPSFGNALLFQLRGGPTYTLIRCGLPWNFFYIDTDGTLKPLDMSNGSKISDTVTEL